MKIKLGELKKIVAEEWWAENYDKLIVDDEAEKKTSLIVPDDVKKKIRSWLKSMKLA